MPKFISEDNIEQTMPQNLQRGYSYDVIDCWHLRIVTDLDKLASKHMPTKRSVPFASHFSRAK